MGYPLVSNSVTLNDLALFHPVW